MKKMARTIVMLPVASYQKRGLAGATRSVVRAVPVAILEPIQIVTETVSRVTLGLRNWVDPAKKEEEDKKWKTDPRDAKRI
jgi:autophagy-related protein 2